jgi:hypothetical protein
MKTASLAFALLLVLVPASFAGNLTTCANWPTSPVFVDPVYYTQFTCWFYEENVYPFSLVPWMGTDFTNNAVVPGYVIFMDSGDPTNTTDQANLGLWSDVLFFDNNELEGTASSRVFYDSRDECFACFPSYSAAIDFGALFMLEDEVSGTTLYDPGDGNHLYYVNSPVPEPSTMALVFSSFLGLLIIRRRRA